MKFQLSGSILLLAEVLSVSLGFLSSVHPFGFAVCSFVSLKFSLETRIHSVPWMHDSQRSWHISLHSAHCAEAWQRVPGLYWTQTHGVTSCHRLGCKIRPKPENTVEARGENCPSLRTALWAATKDAPSPSDTDTHKSFGPNAAGFILHAWTSHRG